MSQVNDYKELVVWQRSMELARNVYTLCKKMPSSERFGLVSQIQRSAVSIPSNIAEGHGRLSLKDYVHFLYIARGSAAELETQLILSSSIFPGISIASELSAISDIRKMITTLIKRLNGQ